MSKKLEMDRRTFNRLTTIGIAKGIVGFPSDSPYFDQPEKTTPPEKEPKTFDMFGLHDTPNVGGSRDIKVAISDLQTLGAKFLVTLDPSLQLLKDTTAADIAVISRAYLPNNTFDDDYLIRLMRKLKHVTDIPLVQPFNEVNLLQETGGVVKLPEQHIRSDFLQAADLISLLGGRTLLTPLAQEAPVDEYDYLDRMLITLLQNKTPQWIARYIALGVHSYIFTPGENPWQRIQRLDSLVVKNVGTHLPIYVTEAGIHQTQTRQQNDETIGRETVRLLDTPIPLNLPIQSFCFWVLANFAQRPREHQTEASSVLHDFEVATWRGLHGPKQVFKRVQEYAQKDAREAHAMNQK